MRALIVDDEKPNREGLRLMLQQFCPEINSISEADSAKAAREVLRNSPADILFLDINMPNENGFEFLSSVYDNSFAVIFVTAYSEFALRAFKANAVDYLLKPVDGDELVAAVEKSKLRLSQLTRGNSDEKIYTESLTNLKGVLESRHYPSKLTLPHLQGFNIISTQDIICIEADGNYSELFLSGQKNLVVTRALREFEFLLNPEIFFRTHKSAIINLQFLKEYKSIDGHFALMQNGKEVAISRRKLDEFMLAIDKLSRRV